MPDEGHLSHHHHQQSFAWYIRRAELRTAPHTAADQQLATPTISTLKQLIQLEHSRIRN